MKIKVAMYKQTGEAAGEMELPEKIFGIDLNSDLVHQVFVSQAANQREVTAHVKGRGEVSGGGKKPWAQKHTGRARHGSIRSPIWTGGGVTHGPQKERNFSKKINRKMRRKALFMVLSAKAKKDLLVFVEGLQAEKGKSKALGIVLKKLPCGTKKNTLIVLPDMQKDIIRAGNNLSFAKTTQARELNIVDLLAAKYVVIPKDSIQVIEKTFAV